MSTLSPKPKSKLAFLAFDQSQKRLILQSLLLLIAFIGLSFLVATQAEALQSTDQFFYSMSQMLGGWLWVNGNWLLSFIGKGAILFTAATCFFFFLFISGWKKEAAWYAVSLIIGMQINSSLKMFFIKERPVPIYRLEQITSFSFPSGHSFGAMIFFLLTYLFLRQIKPHWDTSNLRCGIVFIIVGIGLSRIFLGVHWASDVLGGFLFGLLWVHLNVILLKAFHFFPSSYEKI